MLLSGLYMGILWLVQVITSLMEPMLGPTKDVHLARNG
jgi:hypothetical protein